LGLNDDTTPFNQHAFQIWQTLARVRTMIPVKVMAVNVNSDGTGGTVDAQPLVNQMDGAGNCFPHGTVFSLPYFRLQAGENAVVIDPQVGDVGPAGICDRDISSVKANKGVANPGSRRKFNMADGIYFGGILNKKPTCRLQISDRNITMTPDDGMTSIILTPGFIDIKGTVRTDGDITGGHGSADSVSLRTHIHAQPNDSHGDTESPTNSPTPGT
jgi:hypothetical protein